MAAKLLLADDSVTIQRVIELTFADENVQVVAVGDGRAAIERVQSDRPDIVLADIGMPERDGYEVAAFIKSNPDLAHIPVLLLIGAFEPIDEARARSVGCEGVLVKPFEPQMVISRVRELLGKVVSPSQAPAPAPSSPPASPPAAAAGGEPAGPDALEDYFDRLDAALSTLTAPPPPLEPAITPPQRPEASQTAEQRRQPVERPASRESVSAPVAPAAGAGRADPQVVGLGGLDAGIPLHEAFAALLAAEKGHPIEPFGPTRESMAEEFVEEIVGRVLAKMGGEAMRKAVLDQAERLVREEIDRIRKHAG